MENAKSEIKKISCSLGADLFGVADVTGVKKEFLLSKNVLERCTRAISIGVRLSGLVLEDIESFPTRLYYYHYRIVNSFLDHLALRVANYIQNNGYWALSIPASVIVDWQSQSAHLSHKKIGYLAGLGWLGRNNLLVNKELGSRFRLVTILTDVTMEVDGPKEENCGECRVCLDFCPVGAIKESRNEFDHVKCLDKLKDFQKQRLVGQYICGICVKACRGKSQKDE